MDKMMNKKGAVELSISTIVIVVLAMSMLILGLVLIKNIFSGATDNVSEMNDQVKDQIKGMFEQDKEKKAILRLTESTLEVKKGDDFGFAFGIQNKEEGVSTASTFKYVTVLDDDNIANKDGGCGVSKSVAEKWVRFGSGTVAISPGEFESLLIKGAIPETAPLCSTKYRIIIFRPDKGESITNPYDELYFYIDIKSKGLF